MVGNPPSADMNAEVAKISALQKVWEAAATASDSEQLSAILADDVVAVHMDGRCLRGKDEVKADFMKRWNLFDSELKFSPADILVRDKWAIETSVVERTATGMHGGAPIRSKIRLLIALAQQADGSWKVARILALAN